MYDRVFIIKSLFVALKPSVEHSNSTFFIFRLTHISSVVKKARNQITRKHELKNRLLKVNEVINHCAISRATLYRLIAKGHFPASRKISPEGRAVAWLKSDVEEWIETRAKY